MSPFAVDQATADRWIADKRFTVFGEGGPWATSESIFPGHREVLATRPPAWMVEAAKPCEQMFCVDGRLPAIGDPSGATIPCLDCSNGQRRHPVTVPAFDNDGTWIAHPDARHVNGRITVAHAIPEWGPWQIVESWVGARSNPIPVVCLSHNGFLDWRWSSDDLSLAGQWAIGGRIEVAS